MDSIGMEHKLHLKKLLLARQKLTPLSAAEQAMANSVRREDLATATREEIPDIDTAFSQVLYGTGIIRYTGMGMNCSGNVPYCFAQ